MIHPDTELQFIDANVGMGVVATKLIPRGTITWVRDALDVALPRSTVERLHALYRPTLLKYSFVDARGDYILCWDHARFVNHACDAACLTGGAFDFEFAIRDIRPGEQLCDDYGTLNLLEPFTCACGASACRGTIRPSDAESLASFWDERIREAFPAIGETAQPLMSLVDQVDEVMRKVRDPSSLASCRGHFGPNLGSTAP